MNAMNAAPSLTHLLATLPDLLLVVRIEDYCQAGPAAVLPRRDPAHLCLLLTTGEAQVLVAHERYVVPANSLVFIPAEQVFAWQFGVEAAGYLCRFAPALLAGQAAPEELNFAPGGTPLVPLAAATTGHLQKVMDRILSLRYQEGLPPLGLLQSYLFIILAEARHVYLVAPAAPVSAARQLTATFRRLLADRITHTHHVGTYAAWLRVTSNHLGKAVKTTTGKSPKAWLEEALVLEAQVLLQTDLPIAEVARQVGLQDSFYFSRLFKKVTGQRPGQWRAALGLPAAD